MKTMTSSPMFRTSFAMLLFSALTMPGAFSATIVSENFGGTGADLNGTAADTFDSGITSAGGSGTWAAATPFKDDGGVVGGNNDGAYLDMGSYINDAKGTASGKFTLSVTLDSVPSSPWLGFGFFVSNTPDTDVNFTEAGGLGSGTIIWRNTDLELDGFAGPGSSNGVDGPNGVSNSAQLLTVVLDLTTHDNASDFGTVSFFQGDGTGTAFGSHSYTSDISFGSVGLTSAGNSVDGSYSSFELTQVPEPSTALVGSLGLLALFRRRR
jgi:hypothetical protein